MNAYPWSANRRATRSFSACVALGSPLVPTVRISEGGRTSVAAGKTEVYAVELALPGETAPVYEIDPASATVLDRTIEAGRNPTGMAVGAGSLWITNYDDGTVTRYQP